MRAILMLMAVLSGCATQRGDLTCADNLHDWWPNVEVCFDEAGVPRTIEAPGPSGSVAYAATDLDTRDTRVEPGVGPVEIDWPPGRPLSLGFGCCTLWERD